MSYILAALKKADQEHFLGTVPDLATPQEVQPPEPRSFKWHWLIISLLAVNAALVAVLLMNRDPEVATAAVAEPAVGAEQAAVTEPVPAPPVEQATPMDIKATQAAPQADDTRIDMAPPPARTMPPVVAAPARAGGQVVVLPDPARLQGGEATPVPDVEPAAPVDGIIITQADPRLQGWFDLPREFRNQLELPRLDVHVYSEDPQGRFIMVNLKKYREGEALPNGMALEEILPDGMVMSYRGERFRVDK